MEIYMESIELPGYDIKVNKWIFGINHNQMIVYYKAPVPDPSPQLHLVTNWKGLDLTSKTWVPSADFNFEQSDAMEYQKIFQKAKKSMIMVNLKYLQFFLLVHDSKGKSLHVQPKDLDAGEYLQFWYMIEKPIVLW